MGSKSSKFVKKYEYHSHLQQIQHLLDELQCQQSSFSRETKENSEKYEDCISELNTKIQNQAKSLSLADQQIILLKEKLGAVDELDTMKVNLNKVTVEHNEDRIKMSSHLKDAIGKEKNKWENEILDLKKRLEGIRQQSMQMVSLDLQHEREIHDLQQRIYRLESKVRCPKASSELLATSTGSDTAKPRKLSETPGIKDSAFYSLKPSYNLFDSGSCNVDNDSSSTYHLRFSKINMAMHKLKDDLKYAELKKTASVS